MYIKGDLTKVKERLGKSVGSRVRLESNKGRQKSFYKEGIIENVYPSIFIIQLFEKAGLYSGRRESYSYTDVLTRTIEITLYE